jgi:cytochrome c-type biogenesis protein CcmF
MSVTGHAALFLALAASLYAAFAYVTGVKAGRPGLVSSAGGSLLVSGALVTLSVIVLGAALLTHDFRLSYVASYSSRGMLPTYLVSALWAGNDGSLLFWAWLLSIFAIVMALRWRERNRELASYASGIVMLVQSFFLIVVLAVANPFRTLATVPADGVGLNPMLENIGMILHPPALLAGYAALTVPFALAMAALLSDRPGGDWLGAVRGWALLAWLLLGVGNIIGAWWAYVELGWGGYWAWDPVENAGLMPWLVITAFLHSSLAQRRRGIFKVWTMLLVIIAFGLTVFGTYINRSGVLTSVHTYAESAVGPFFLVFMIIVLATSFGLLYYRRDSLKSEAEVEVLVSRESTFLLNNILLMGITAIIFSGTVVPMAVHIVVGRDFFDRVSGPIFLAIILLVGLCTLIGWRSVAAVRFLRLLTWPAAGAAVVSILLVILGVREGYAVAGSFICGLGFFVVLSRMLRGGHTISRHGSHLVHLAIVVIAAGIIGSSFYGVSKSVSLQQGSAATIKGYTVVYAGLSGREAPDEQIVTATLEIYRGDRLLTTMTPEKIFHRSYAQPVSEVAIHTTPLEDLYVILASWDANGTASFTLLVNPLVVWIWVGGGIFLIGGLLAFWLGRRASSSYVFTARKLDG